MTFIKSKLEAKEEMLWAPTSVLLAGELDGSILRFLAAVRRMVQLLSKRPIEMRASLSVNKVLALF